MCPSHPRQIIMFLEENFIVSCGLSLSYLRTRLSHSDQIEFMEDEEKMVPFRCKIPMLDLMANRSSQVLANKQKNNNNCKVRGRLRQAQLAWNVSAPVPATPSPSTTTGKFNGKLDRRERNHVVCNGRKYFCASSKFGNKNGYLRLQTFRISHFVLQAALLAFFVLLIQQPSILLPQIGCQSLSSDARTTTTIQNNHAIQNGPSMEEKAEENKESQAPSGEFGLSNWSWEVQDAEINQ